MEKKIFSSNCDRKGQSYSVDYYLELGEEYSEGKIHKSEPEPGNRNVDTVSFVHQVRGNTRISCMEFVFAMNEHAIANVYSVIFELLRMFVKNILFQISFCA